MPSALQLINLLCWPLLDWIARAFAEIVGRDYPRVRIWPPQLLRTRDDISWCRAMAHTSVRPKT